MKRTDDVVTKKSEDSVTSVPASPNKGRGGNASSSSSAPVSPTKKSRGHVRGDSQEDSGDSDSKDSQEKEGSASLPSIKDRISAYAGVRNSARNFRPRAPANYQTTYTKRERPPKIDIYEEARRQEESKPEEEESTGIAPEPSVVPPSPAAAAAADAAAELVRRKHTSSSSKSIGSTRTTPKATSGVAGAFLAAIKTSSPPTPSNSKPVVTQTTSAPLTEIAASNEGNGDNDSVAASSMSGDDFALSPTSRRNEFTPTSNYLSKKPSWSERSKPQISPSVKSAPSAYNGKSNGSSSQPKSPSPAEMEKIVEQRVQARVSVVEMRMEEQMQRLEKRMEEKMNAHVKSIETKIEKMNTLLSALVSRELSSSKNEI